MPFKINFIFSMRADRDASWTESYWNNVNDGSSAYNEALTFAPILRGLHGLQSVLIAFRLSPVNTKRGGKLIRTENTAKALADDTQSDYMTAALLAELGGNGGYTVRQWVKGVPDKQIDKGGKFVPTLTYPAAITAWASALTSAGSNWRLRCLDKAVKAKYGWSIAVDGTITAPAHGIPAVDANGDPTLVKVGGLQPPVGTLIPQSKLNKTWKIVNVQANTFQLNGWPTGVQAVTTGASYYRQVVYTYPVITSAELQFATSHKVSRPLLVVGGHRRKR